MRDVHHAHSPTAVTTAFLAGILLILCLTTALERTTTDPSPSSTAAPPEQLEHWSARELRSLPGLGEKRAVAIVRERHAGRIDGTLESLDHVPGIGPGTVNAVRIERDRRCRRGPSPTPVPLPPIAP